MSSRHVLKRKVELIVYSLANAMFCTQKLKAARDSALDSGLASSLLMTEGVLVPCFLHVVKVKALVLFSEEVFFPVCGGIENCHDKLFIRIPYGFCNEKKAMLI